MSSDSDSDFSDAADSNSTEKDEHAATNVKTNKNGMKVRGKDLDWVETNKFADANNYKNSDIAKQLEKEFTVRKNREFAYADVQIYHCKFSRSRFPSLLILQRLLLNLWMVLVVMSMLRILKLSTRLELSSNGQRNRLTLSRVV